MSWKVTLKKSAFQDLRWFGRKTSRGILDLARDFLEDDPLAQTRNMKTLRPNPIAERELRLQGKYRVLFNVDSEEKVVRIVLVGEKRGNTLVVQGEEFHEHESDTTK